MNESATRFPLYWPAGRPRTPGHRRDRPKFQSPSFAAARDGLFAELRRLGASKITLSTNVELRQDGIPYAGRRQPDDPGVAVYFARKSKELCLCCDRWVKIEDNLRAITDAVACIRMIERRGTGDMVDAAFAGFTALPAHPMPAAWHVTLGVPGHASTEQVTEAWRGLALQHHPDRNGGEDSKAKDVNAAYERFKKERGL